MPVVVKVFLHSPTHTPADPTAADPILAVHAERLGQIRRRLCFPPGKCPNLLPYQRWAGAEVGLSFAHMHTRECHDGFFICVEIPMITTITCVPIYPLTPNTDTQSAPPPPLPLPAAGGEAPQAQAA